MGTSTDTERMVTVPASKLAELAQKADELATMANFEHTTGRTSTRPYFSACEIMHALRELADA